MSKGEQKVPASCRPIFPSYDVAKWIKIELGGLFEWWVGFVPGISRDGNSREITDFPGKIPGNKKLTGFPGNFPVISRYFVAFPVSRFPGNEKSGKLQTLHCSQMGRCVA